MTESLDVAAADLTEAIAEEHTLGPAGFDPRSRGVIVADRRGRPEKPSG